MSAQNNRITDSSDATLAASVAYASLVPAKSSTISGGQIQFRIRSRNAAGYRVDATATFIANPTAAVSGGTTITASDIGLGITSVAGVTGVDLPRADVILSGFNYDPTTVAITGGLTPYKGIAGGQATISDLLTGHEVLHGNRIAGNINSGSTSNYLTVTLKAGLLPQYFTPCSFSAVITLTISNGP